MTASDIVVTDEYKALLLSLDPDVTFDFDYKVRTEFFRKYSLPDENYYQEFAFIYKIMSASIFFAERSSGALFGLYQPDGKKDVIFKVDQHSSISILGDSISNWVDEEYLNTNAYNTAEFKRKCFELFGVEASAWNEIWPDIR